MILTRKLAVRSWLFFDDQYFTGNTRAGLGQGRYPKEDEKGMYV
jgi:hypothetical protein